MINLLVTLGDIILLYIVAKYKKRNMKKSQKQQIKIFIIVSVIVILIPLVFLFYGDIDQNIKRFAEFRSYIKILIDPVKEFAWPVSVTIILIYYKDEITQLFQSNQETVMKIGAVEVKMTAKQANDALSEIFREIDTILKSSLSSEEKELFLRILTSVNPPKVGDIWPDFTRGSNEHKMLQNLRGVYFIRPVKGGKWEKDKYIQITQLGRIVERYKQDILRQQSSSDI